MLVEIKNFLVNTDNVLFMCPTTKTVEDSPGHYAQISTTKIVFVEGHQPITIDMPYQEVLDLLWKGR